MARQAKEMKSVVAQTRLSPGDAALVKSIAAARGISEAELLRALIEESLAKFTFASVEAEAEEAVRRAQDRANEVRKAFAATMDDDKSATKRASAPAEDRVAPAHR